NDNNGSPYASLGSSPDLAPQQPSGSPLPESPVDDGYFLDEFDEPDPNMPPPTTSTYNHREKPLAPPPSIAELKADLTGSLDAAAGALDARERAADDGDGVAQQPRERRPSAAEMQGWYEVQGMHTLDVMTLAIRAAKMYYTAHEQPDRLDAIK